MCILVFLDNCNLYINYSQVLISSVHSIIMKGKQGANTELSKSHDSSESSERVITSRRSRSKTKKKKYINIDSDSYDSTSSSSRSSPSTSPVKSKQKKRKKSYSSSDVEKKQIKKHQRKGKRDYQALNIKNVKKVGNGNKETQVTRVM